VDKIYKALAEGNRRKILFLLKKHELSVSSLLRHFRVGQPTLSNHLSILAKAGLVRARVQGKKRIYQLEKTEIKKLLEELSLLADNGDNIKLLEDIVTRNKHID